MSLDQEEYVEETLEGIDLSGETLDEVRFDGCTLVGWSAADATLRQCAFDDCVFRGCDLSNAKLFDTRLRGVRFERCKLMGVDFGAAYSIGLEVRFSGCVLSYASFAGMALRELELIECRAHETIFDDADLRDALFTESDLRGARFGGTDLRGADLSEATGYAIDPTLTKVKGTKMSMEGALESARLLGIEV